MQILLPENKSFDIDFIPEVADEYYYCTLNAVKEKEIDHFFKPLVFLESYYSPAVVLQIGPYTLKMPLDWNILVTDEEFSTVEPVPLTSLNERGFLALIYNPLEYRLPRAEEIRIVSVYNELKWYNPKINDGNFLIVPLHHGEEPRCCAFAPSLSKIHRNLDLNHIITYE